MNNVLRLHQGIREPDNLSDQEWAQAFADYQFKEHLQEELLERAFTSSLTKVLNELFKKKEDGG